MPKATAMAHAIQGLVKYHGLKDKKRRIPFHDSISVCAEKLTTKATIEFGSSYPEDAIEINGKTAEGVEAARVLSVISPLRAKAKTKLRFRLASTNSLPEGKGLGFSAAAFASIALASSKALGLKIDLKPLSEIARLGAGSASRSLVGGFSIWYANKNGRSYAEQLPTSRSLILAMAIVPVASAIRTDRAHEESIGSPFFGPRLKEVKSILPQMLRAIRTGNLDRVGRIAETESLSLHAVTMTGKSGLLLMAPETIRVIRRVLFLREHGHVPVWYSLDTGPSVYVNTSSDFLDTVCKDIESDTGLMVLRSGVGGPAHLSSEHLF
jgi:phosphomevalonate decarboxylase